MTIAAITPFFQAASAYGTGASRLSAAADAAGASTGGASTAGASTGGGFSDMVSQAAASALAGLHRAEQVTASGVAGKTDVQAVVQAMSSAELTMQSVVAVRDKVVGAYSDIMRMSV